MSSPSPDDRLWASQDLPLRDGDHGEAVRDLQRRLVSLGLTPGLDGMFCEHTVTAVAAFQASRGLLDSGICDQATWNAVIEAGHRLGDRLLYLSRPMLRGEDVTALQRRLGGLGFDAGRVDGIFGPDTDAALREFQRNAGLSVDGVCGPTTLMDLERFANRISEPAAVAGVREREKLRSGPRGLDQRTVVIAHAGGLDAIAHAAARALSDTGAETVVLQHHDPSALADQANTLRCDLLVDLEVGDPPCWCAFYQSGDFESSGGRRLAELLTSALADIGLNPGPSRGLRLTLLRETRMPAVVVHLGPVDRVVTDPTSITEACTRAVADWAREPIAPEH